MWMKRYFEYMGTWGNCETENDKQLVLFRFKHCHCLRQDHDFQKGFLSMQKLHILNDADAIALGLFDTLWIITPLFSLLLSRWVFAVRRFYSNLCPLCGKYHHTILMSHNKTKSLEQLVSLNGFCQPPRYLQSAMLTRGIGSPAQGK